MFGPSKAALQHSIDFLNWELVEKNAEIKKLKEQVESLSIQKDPTHSVGALDYVVYKSKILDKIGNSYLSATDNPSFKLGIQFALRHFEEVAVSGR
jgi:hypothetical protein